MIRMQLTMGIVSIIKSARHQLWSNEKSNRGKGQWWVDKWLDFGGHGSREGDN